MAEMFPAWQYIGIRDGRQGKDHEPHFDKYYPSSAKFEQVRGPRVWNCRCCPAPISKYEWQRLQSSGVTLSTFAERPRVERFAAEGWKGPYTGERGGTYWLSPSGEKSYEEPTAGVKESKSEDKPKESDGDGPKHKTREAAIKSPEFKSFFGDWENDPANASKVVGEDGKPLVVYHGTPETFDSFDPEAGAKLGGFGHGGAFFSASPEVAGTYAFHQSLKSKQADQAVIDAEEELNSYIDSLAKKVGGSPPKERHRDRWLSDLLNRGEIGRDEYDHAYKLEDNRYDLDNAEISDKDAETKPQTVPAFLNLRRPKIVDAGGLSWDVIVPRHMANTDRTQYDGIIFKNIRDSGGEDDIKTTNFVVFSPTQIKSATGNRGTFDPKSANIKHAERPPVEQFAEWKPYTNPRDGRTGAISTGGRVVYGTAAQQYLGGKDEGKPAADYPDLKPGKA